MMLSEIKAGQLYKPKGSDTPERWEILGKHSRLKWRVHAYFDGHLDVMNMRTNVYEKSIKDRWELMEFEPLSPFKRIESII